ncbi:MAG TPA: NAD(P)-binding domain-containing protein [Rhodopseudomonas sp.]|uniref:flavin-containing monooxygenase n=1 Tax=Rhodopseudomonas sp. TaxID=1078 RepID=UPI002EDBABD2
MTQRLAIVGAGPSGLAAAKAALEYGVEPIVFDAAPSLGGLWRRKGGYTWHDMRTNLSKWTCAFSDYPWPDTADEFPLGSAVESYLQGYASAFGVDRKVECGTKVESVVPSGNKWLVKTSQAAAPLEVDGVCVAGGTFARPAIPALDGIDQFKGVVLHSCDFKEAAPFKNKRVAVVGASFSGIEIASHLATHGVEVVILFEKAPWILPRYAPLGDGSETTMPLDLLLYRRSPAGTATPEPSLEDRYRRAAQRFEAAFGNPGAVHSALRVAVDETPPFYAISDLFLPHVKNREILPIRERVKSLYDAGIVTEGDQRLPVDAIVFCTGYGVDFSFLDPAVRKALAYDPSDNFVSHIAHRTVMRPELQNLSLVGLYRGPFFGIIELQARWAAALLAGAVPRPSAATAQAGMEREIAIRCQRPRPQFPHGEYVAFADEIAGELGIFPVAASSGEMNIAVRQGPVVPAHYRLVGPHAKVELAESQIRSACSRAGFK